jgi:hypothetical protein
MVFDFTPPVPETFAMLDGRLVGTRMVAIDSRGCAPRTQRRRRMVDGRVAVIDGRAAARRRLVAACGMVDGC